MNQIFMVCFLLVGCAFCSDLPAYPSPSPAYPAAQTYNAKQEPLMPYNFNYAVKDDPTYNNFAHQETADTKAVTGTYRVALPDGRTQIVTYKADEYGYVADVKYEGEAKYPDAKAYLAYPSLPPSPAPAY